MPIKYRLAQEAETQIDRAWKGLDTKFGNSVTNMETADNPNSEFKPNTQDVSRSSSIHSPSIRSTESNNKIDNNTPENQLRTSFSPSSQSGKSDVPSVPSTINSQNSHSKGNKMNPKAEAGQNQEVIEGFRVTLDGTKSKIGAQGAEISYSWKQVAGPKVRIIDANTAIASFEAPKISSAEDKLTLKFVLSIADSLGRNNDKDTVIVVVKHDPSVNPIVDSQSSTNINDNKDGTASHAERNGHSNNNQVVDNVDNSKPNVNGKSEEIQNEEAVPSPDNMEPAESTEANTDSGNSIG